MPLLEVALVAMADAVQSKLAWAQTHSGDPGADNTANVNTGGRFAPAWTTPDAAGNFNLSAPLAFSGLAANAPISYITFWDAQVGGNCTGKFPTAGDTTANASGEASLTGIPLSGVTT